MEFWPGEMIDSLVETREVFQTIAAESRLEGIVVAWDPGPTKLSCVHRRCSR